MWPNIRSDTCGRVEFSTILSITILSFIVVYALLPCYSECIYLLSVVVSDLNNNNFKKNSNNDSKIVYTCVFKILTLC